MSFSSFENNSYSSTKSFSTFFHISFGKWNKSTPGRNYFLLLFSKFPIAVLFIDLLLN